MPASASSGQGSIEWYYDATGRKLRKVSGTNSVTYIDGIEKYDNGSIFIMHPEGRSAVIPNGEHPLPWHVEFTMRDHLGNTRVAFSDLNEDGSIQLAGTDPSGVPIPSDYTELLQENHYYPFGLNMEGQWYPPQKAAWENKYQYNVKEFNNNLGLNWNDYGARWYDAAVGRWNSVDPLSDIAPTWTPYRFGFNNPILYTDPLGLFETRKEARDFKKKHNIKGRVRKDGDTYYVKERGKGGSQYAYGSEAAGYGTDRSVTERGVHLRDIGLDGFNALSNPYSESYNPHAVVFTNWADILYAFGSYLGLASPTARINLPIKAPQITSNISKEVSIHVSKVINIGKQGKHIIGHNNYIKGRSVLTEDAQALLDAFHSSNIESSQVINSAKTRVDFGKVIGTYINSGTGEAIPTTKGIIVNSNTGVHIIPSSPK